MPPHPHLYGFSPLLSSYPYIALILDLEPRSCLPVNLHRWLKKGNQGVAVTLLLHLEIIHHASHFFVISLLQ